jgi:ferrochelatase
MAGFDAFLLLSFGGPEKHEDVLPFLENVTRGRGVPRERLLEVAEHYYHFDGISPINEQCRALLRDLHLELPIYWGNRNWHPFLADTMRQMMADGRKKILAFPTSAFSNYSGCRQYREDILKAQAEVGPGAPEVVTVRRFFNHPLFIEVMRESLRAALAERPGAKVIFTAHSVPMSMANTSPYVEQLEEASRLVAEGANYRLAYQSRSGPPQIPWLEPDILDVLREEKAAGTADVVVQPIGFLSDHMEVMYDLDYEAKHLADELGLGFTRAATAGTHPKFLQMIRELVEEYTHGAPAQAVGNLPARPAVCPVDCCPAPVRPAGPAGGRPGGPPARV